MKKPMTSTPASSTNAQLMISGSRTPARRLPGRGTTLMCEDILLRPAAEIESGANRDEVEAGLRKLLPVLASQHGVEPRSDLVQIDDIEGGILLLGVREHRQAPVGALLLLRQLDAEHFANQILEAVAVGVGAGELGGDLGAIDRRHVDAEPHFQGGDIEAGEMKDLEDAGVGQQRLEARRLEGLAIDLDEMRIAVARGQLDKTELVAMGAQPHGFGVDRDLPPEIERWRQVAPVKLDQHLPRAVSLAPCVPPLREHRLRRCPERLARFWRRASVQPPAFTCSCTLRLFAAAAACMPLGAGGVIGRACYHSSDAATATPR